MSSPTRHQEYRIVIVGAGGVGKSALTVMFLQGTFLSKYDPTIEDSYRSIQDVDGVSCTLDIMDTAGQEEFAALRDTYMKTGDGFLVVYSVTSRTSFETVDFFKNHIYKVQEGKPEIPMVLVGNKTDLEHERQVTPEEGEKWAKKNSMGWLETSAKRNQGVAEMFYNAVRYINRWRLKYAPPAKEDSKEAKGGKRGIRGGKKGGNNGKKGDKNRNKDDDDDDDERVVRKRRCILM